MGVVSQCFVMADLTQALTLLRRNSEKKVTDTSPTLQQSLHSQSQDHNEEFEDYDVCWLTVIEFVEGSHFGLGFWALLSVSGSQ